MLAGSKRANAVTTMSPNDTLASTETGPSLNPKSLPLLT